MLKTNTLKRFWRSRAVIITAALVLAGMAGMGIWQFFRKPNGPCCYYQEVITDGRVHPLHLTYPDGREGKFDLVCVTNHSKYPLALMAFSARPHAKEDLRHPRQIMGKWAAWILRSKAIITIKPGYSWVLNPKRDVKHINRFHGRTWLVVYYKGARKRPTGLVQTELPSRFTGRFSVYFVPSSLPLGLPGRPTAAQKKLAHILDSEANILSKGTRTLPPGQITRHTGLSKTDLY